MIDLLVRLVRETGRFLTFGVDRGFRGVRDGATPSERFVTWIGAWVWMLVGVLVIWVLSIL